MADRDKECEYCGKSFWASSLKKKYCTALCAQRAWHKMKTGLRLENPKYTRDCLQCGNEIRTNDVRKKFCDSRCNVAFQNAKRKTTKRERRECPVCQKTFQPMQKRGVGKTYCSKKCRDRAAYVRNKPRQNDRMFDYRKRRKWGGNWWAALERDGFSCQLCGLKAYPSQWHGKRKIVVHHRDGTGEHKSKNHDLDNLLTLCDPCHKLFHSGVNLIFEDGEYFVDGRIFEILGIKKIKTKSRPE